MADNDPKIIKSPLCRKFTADGITVSVEIYKLATSEVWSLELVDEDGNSTVWDDLFPSDQAAWHVLMVGVQELGLKKLLEPEDENPPTVH